MQDQQKTGLPAPEISEMDDTPELVELIRNLPRETKLIIYGQVLAHTTMAGIDLRPQPA